MDKVKLGRTDLGVTKICLGTMTFGQQNTEAEAHSQLDLALERGINFIDTAEMYPVPPRAEAQGSTERFIGSWLKSSAFNNVDVIKDFSANDNDAIDISDVLDTYYTHGVDVLTDFVQITTNGANSELRVDTTGTGTFGSGTLIAVVEGVTGLTDEVALATAGRLIAA